MAVTLPNYQDRPWLKSYPAGISATLDYPEIPLHEFLVRSAETHARKTALVFFGGETSYAALFDEVRRIAAGLKRLGLKKGDRVALMLPNCPQMVAAYYGVLWAGGTGVMANPLYTARELEHLLRDSGARFIFCLDSLAHRVKEVLGTTPLERVIVTGIQDRLPFPLNIAYPLKLMLHGESPRPLKDARAIRYLELIQEPPRIEAAPVDPRRDLALLQYTGGTTGTPKAVMLTHFNLVANCTQLKAWSARSVGETITILGVIPFFHVYGLSTCMNFGIMNGARIVLFPRFETGRILKSIEKYRPRQFPGVPTMYIAMNNYPGVERLNLRSIEQCLSGAAPLPEEVKIRFEQLTGARLVEGYGLTEASPVTHANIMHGTSKTRGIGLPLPDTECRLVDLETGKPATDGNPGELLIRGPQVMQGYWEKPEDTAETLKDGWLHTGDVARMDPDGYFFIVDRKKEMIIASGFKIYPRDVEEVLYQHPAVKEAVVIGIPDQYRGETVKAFIILKDGVACTSEEITDWCRQRLASFKVPRFVEFVDELPKSLVGKVLRRVLQEQERARMLQESPTPADSASNQAQPGAAP